MKDLFYLFVLFFLLTACAAHLRVKKEMIGSQPKISCLKDIIAKQKNIKLVSERSFSPPSHPTLNTAKVLNVLWTFGKHPLNLQFALESCKDSTSRTVFQLLSVVPFKSSNYISSQFEKVSDKLLNEIGNKCQINEMIKRMKPTDVYGECGLKKEAANANKSKANETSSSIYQFFIGN